MLYTLIFRTDVEEKLSNLTVNNMTNTSEYEEAFKEKERVSMFYTTLILSITLLNILEVMLFFHFTMSVSVTLHNEIFSKMMKATMNFFDSHLTGNILNRFAKDTAQIDESLPGTFESALSVKNSKSCFVFNLN